MKNKTIAFLSIISFSLFEASSSPMLGNNEDSSSLGARASSAQGDPRQITDLPDKSKMKFSATFGGIDFFAGTALYLGTNESGEAVVLLPMAPLILWSGLGASFSIQTNDGSNSKKYTIANRYTFNYPYLNNKLMPQENFATVTLPANNHPDVRHAVFGNDRLPKSLPISIAYRLKNLEQLTIPDMQAMRYKAEMDVAKARLNKYHSRRIEAEVALDYYNDGIEDPETLISKYQFDLDQSIADLQKCDIELQRCHINLKKYYKVGITDNEEIQEIKSKRNHLHRIKQHLTFIKNDRRKKIERLERGPIDLEKGKFHWLLQHRLARMQEKASLNEQSSLIDQYRSFIEHHPRHSAEVRRVNADDKNYQANEKRYTRNRKYFEIISREFNDFLERNQDKRRAFRRLVTKHKSAIKKRHNRGLRHDTFLKIYSLKKDEEARGKEIDPMLEQHYVNMFEKKYIDLAKEIKNLYHPPRKK